MDKIQNNNSFYDIEKAVLYASQDFFVNEDGSKIAMNTLKTGLFGWLNNVVSELTLQSVLEKSMYYDESFLNTAQSASALYNFAAANNFPIDLSTPSYGEALIGIKLSDILKVIQNTKTYFTIDKNTLFVAGNTIFMLPYEIQVFYSYNQSLPNESMLSVKINKDKMNLSPSTINSDYLEYYYSVSDNMVMIRTNLIQMDKVIQEFIINNTDSLGKLIYKIKFTNQIAGFKVYYTPYQSNTEYELTKYYGSDNITSANISEFRCNYEINDNELSIIFNNNRIGFTPINNSKIRVEVFNCLGKSGNITYNKAMIIDNKLSNSLMPNMYAMLKAGSTGGTDMKSLYELKLALLDFVQSKNEIITDKNVQSYFYNIIRTNNLSNVIINAFKVKDDIARRIFACNLLLKNSTGWILPTNTISVMLSGDKLSNDDTYFNKSVNNDYVLIPAGTNIVCKKTVDAITEPTIMVSSTDDLFSESISGVTDYLSYYVTNYNDYIIYKTFYDIVISKTPFLRASFYRSTINDDYQLSIFNQRNINDKTFILTKFNLNRNALASTNSDKYTISFNVISNIASSGVNTTDSGVNSNKLGALCLIYTLDENNKRTYYGYKEAELDTTNGIKNPFAFKCYIESNNTAESFNTSSLKLYKIDSNGDALSVLSDVVVPNKFYVSVLVVYDTGLLLNSYFSSNGNNNLNYGDSQLYENIPGLLYKTNVLEMQSGEVSIIKSMNNIIYSDFIFNGRDYKLNTLPVIGHKVVSNSADFTYMIGQLSSIESLMLGSLSKLENSNTLSMRFYNTYGKAFNYSTTTTNIYIELSINLYADITTDLDTSIRLHIINLLNTINESGVTRISKSNITTSLENTFTDIQSVTILSINGDNVNDVIQIDDEARQIDNPAENNFMDSLKYTPEYLNIDYNSPNNGLVITYKNIFK